MQTLATVIGFASGFALMGYRESATNLLVTSLAIDASLAPLTAVAASRRGRQAIPWGVLGFPFGVWALAAVLIIPRRKPGSEFKPTSDAA